MDRLHRVLPILAALAAMAVIVTAGLVSITATADRNKAEDTAAEALAVAEKAAAAAAKSAEVGRDVKALLEAQKLQDAERQPIIDDAIRRILDDSADAHAALLGDLARLLNRPVPPPPPPRTTTTTAAPGRVAPTPPQTTTTTTRPATTTTTCPRLPNGKCRP